jgi:hypothetical protein
MGQYDDEIEIFWASGACFFIEASFTEARFDDDFLPIRKKSICAGGLLTKAIR